MLRFSERPLLPTAVKFSIKSGDRRKFVNPALLFFPRLSLGRCAGVKRGLEDPSGEDDLILGGRVVRVDRRRRHAPPVVTRT